MNRALAFGFFLLFGFLTESLTWGFSLGRYRLVSLPFSTLGEFPTTLYGHSWELKAEGGQSYVFVSDDDTHVLKFFKDQPRPWLQIGSYQAQKNKKLYRTLTGYSLMYERCRSLSGIVYLHTNSSSPIPATLIDRLGIQHSIDLNSYLFVLQKKADILQPPTSAEEQASLMQETTRLIQTLAQCHLKDHDPRLQHNLGRLDRTLIVIDPGKISECENPSTELPAKFMEFLR